MRAFVAPHAGKVGVILPVFQGLDDGRLRLRRAGFEKLRPDGQFGLEPLDGLLAKLGPRGVVGGPFVLPRAGCGQGCGARPRCSAVGRPGGRR